MPIAAWWPFADPAPAVFVRMFTNSSKSGSLFQVLVTLKIIPPRHLLFSTLHPQHGQVNEAQVFLCRAHHAGPCTILKIQYISASSIGGLGAITASREMQMVTGA